MPAITPFYSYGAGTLSDLQQTIIQDLNRADTSLSDIILIDIQSSIRQYEGQRFYFNELAYLSIPLVSTVNVYPFSQWVTAAQNNVITSTATNDTQGIGAQIDDVIEVDSLQITVGASLSTAIRNYTLIEKPYRLIDDLDQGSPTLMGYPQYYAPFQKAIRIYPRVSPNLPLMTANLSGHVRFAPLSQPNDSNPWTNDAADLIRNATLRRLWQRRFRDAEGAEVSQQLEQESLQALQRRTSAQAGARIRPVF